MRYILKHCDTNLIEFEMEKRTEGLHVALSWINGTDLHLLPLDMTADAVSLKRWLKLRTIPSNRAYVQSFLSKLGLNEHDTKGILDLCNGLSLNDCYWVVPTDFRGTFETNNLYQNPFSRTLSYLAFTGYGTDLRTPFRSSPEFTTNGMLAKCWRRLGGRILLYKSGTEGASNTGREPYSEFYAYQIATAMGLRAVPYGLSKWQGRLCSTCALFTSLDLSFIAISRLVREGGIAAVLRYYRDLGAQYYEDLLDMFLFDAVVCNEDRHLGNFGVLIENQSNRVVATAPLFDHGLSLLPYAVDETDLIRYADARTPATYSDFMDFPAELLDTRRRAMLRKLIGFRFVRHSRYNLSQTRLTALEHYLHTRVTSMLHL